MGKNFIPKFLSFFAGGVDTADNHSFANISADFWKNSKWSQWDTQRPGGHWFMKKTWSQKSRVRLPLKVNKIENFLASILKFVIFLCYLCQNIKILPKNFLIGPLLGEVRFFHVVQGLRGMKKNFELCPKNFCFLLQFWTLNMTQY